MTTNRGVGGDVLGDAGGLADRVPQGVAVDAVGGGLLGVLAGSARVHEAAGVLVLLGVQHVGALGAELECDLLGMFLGSRLRGGG